MYRPNQNDQEIQNSRTLLETLQCEPFLHESILGQSVCTSLTRHSQLSPKSTAPALQAQAAYLNVKNLNCYWISRIQIGYSVILLITKCISRVNVPPFIYLPLYLNAYSQLSYSLQRKDKAQCIFLIQILFPLNIPLSFYTQILIRLQSMSSTHTHTKSSTMQNSIDCDGFYTGKVECCLGYCTMLCLCYVSWHHAS